MTCERCEELEQERSDLDEQIADLRYDKSTLTDEVQELEGRCDFCEGAKYIGRDDEMKELRATIFELHHAAPGVTICVCSACNDHRSER